MERGRRCRGHRLRRRRCQEAEESVNHLQLTRHLVSYDVSSILPAWKAPP